MIRFKGRPTDIIRFETTVVSFFVNAADVFGVPKSVAAIYAVCFASAEPLGFSEIDERLNLSSGSVSQGLKLLRDVGALKVVGSPLDRRDRFEPDLELRKLISQFIEERLRRQLESGRDSLDGMAALVPETSAAAKVLRDRVATLQAWHEKSREVVPLLTTVLNLR